MAKEKSFAEKVKKSGKKGKQFSVIKYVKSVVSEKTGQYRFQESMLKVPVGMSLDTYLKQLDEETIAKEEAEGEEMAITESEVME